MFDKTLGGALGHHLVGVVDLLAAGTARREVQLPFPK